MCNHFFCSYNCDSNHNRVAEHESRIIGHEFCGKQELDTVSFYQEYYQGPYSCDDDNVIYIDHNHACASCGGHDAVNAKASTQRILSDSRSIRPSKNISYRAGTDFQTALAYATSSDLSAPLAQDLARSITDNVIELMQDNHPMNEGNVSTHAISSSSPSNQASVDAPDNITQYKGIENAEDNGQDDSDSELSDVPEELFSDASSPPRVARKESRFWYYEEISDDSS